MRVNETELTQDLDDRGLLDAARSPGVYALQLDVPRKLRERWREQYDVTPPNLSRLQGAGTALYVGASSNVYRRICEHVNADKRRAAVLRVCPPDGVHDVEPTDEPFLREYGFALEHSDEKTAVWTDGTVL